MRRGTHASAGMHMRSSCVLLGAPPSAILRRDSVTTPFKRTRSVGFGPLHFVEGMGLDEEWGCEGMEGSQP